MYQQQGVISQNEKNSISQNFPNRSFPVIHQNDHIFNLHIAAQSVFMDIFLNPKFSSRAMWPDTGTPLYQIPLSHTILANFLKYSAYFICKYYPSSVVL